MTYPHALAGVKKIYSANILQLIVTVMGLIAAFISLVVPKFDPGSTAMIQITEDIRIPLVIVSVLALAALVLSLIATVREMTGLYLAGKDQRYFKIAFLISILVILVSIGSGVFAAIRNPEAATAAAATEEATLGQRIMDVLSGCASSLVMLLGVMGIGALASSLEEEAISRRAQFASKLVIFILLVTLGLNLAALIVGNQNKTTTIVLGFIALAASLLSLVAYIIYLLLLKRSIHMLELK